MPLRSMSRMRAWMSHAPLRISSKRAGSKLYSLDRPADDGVEADVGQLVAVVHPRLRCRRPCSTTRGARSASWAGTRPSNVCGGSTMWSSTEITV